VFFFSSRRRHTRFSRDWSSDVCSSDLAIGLGALLALFFLSYAIASGELTAAERARGLTEGTVRLVGAALVMFYIAFVGAILALRSEERRVGKECRSGRAPYA